MAQVGKAHLLITFVAPAAKVPEIDRLVASHGAWMAETHHRSGPKALLSYSFSKGPDSRAHWIRPRRRMAALGTC